MKTLLSILLGASLLSGCASYNVQTNSIPSKRNDSFNEVRKTALNHPLYSIVPRKKDQIKTLDIPHLLTWNLLGNDDDGIFGEEMKSPYSTNINFSTFMRWQTRNPMHNLCFYTIGSSSWKRHYNFDILSVNNAELNIAQNTSNINDPRKHYFRFSLNDFKPFLSINLPYSKKKEGEMWLGWRRNGAFEIKLRPYSSRKIVRLK